MTRFDDAMSAEGWTRVTGKKEEIATASVPSATLRRGPVRIEVYSGELAMWKGSVCVYIATKPAWVLGAIVVDEAARRKGAGKEALESFLRVGRALGVEEVYMHVAPMKKYKAKMTKPELVEWYGRHGFRPTEDTNTVLVRKEFPANPV